MKNTITCNNCTNENPFHKLNCTNCGSYLRNRVPNIDLWSFSLQLFEDPKKAFSNIIYAEHKNFIIILSLFYGIKFFLFGVFLKTLLNTDEVTFDYFITNFSISIVSFAAYLSLFSFGTLYIIKKYGIPARFKDIYSIFIYSLIPQIFALILLAPVNHAFFGQHWLLFNPPPHLINSSVAYILWGIEGILFLWSIAVVIVGLYVQTKNKKFSIGIGLLFSFSIFLLTYLIPLITE